MTIRQTILAELAVTPMSDFNPENEIRARVDFLKSYLKEANRSKLILGISGGVDSSTAGKLAQIAVNELKAEGDSEAEFIAMRLPYGVQADENDAQAAITFIKPDTVVTVNIKESTDAINNQQGGDMDLTDYHRDFCKGNIKARQRMVAQYHQAGLVKGLVIGTDHNAEAIVGFYTLFGDGACDIMPLSGLNKRQVRKLAETLGAPKHIYQKVATADLEDNQEQLSDEVALGVTYEQIDDYLEGKEIDAKARAIIEERFLATTFKRRMPKAYGA